MKLERTIGNKTLKIEISFGRNKKMSWGIEDTYITNVKYPHLTWFDLEIFFQEFVGNELIACGFANKWNCDFNLFFPELNFLLERNRNFYNLVRELDKICEMKEFLEIVKNLGQFNDGS